MKKQPIIFPVLASEMKRRKIRKRDLAELLDVCDKSMFNKLYGYAPITWDEVCLIRTTYFPDLSSDELFRREKRR